MNAPTATDATPPALHALEALIRQMQSGVLHGTEPYRAFDELLPELLRCCESEYGFIGEEGRNEAGKPVLSIVTVGAAPEGTRPAAEPAAARVGDIALHELEPLFGAAFVTGEPVIANDATRGLPALRALPNAPPALHSFLGVPLHYGGERVGLVGVANRPGGYAPALLAALTPLFQSMAGVMAALRIERQRRAAEARLRASEERWRTTFEMAGVGVVHVGVGGRILDANARMCEIVGRSREELLRLRGEDITHPEHDAADRERFHKLVTGETDSLLFEKRYLRGDGSPVWAQLAVTAARDLQGKFLRTVTIVLDIDQRKRAETALQAREALFSKLASKVPGVLMQFHVDTAGHATVPYANAAMRELFELDPEGPVRDNAALMIDRVVKGQRGKVWGTLEESGRTLKPWQLEWEIDLPTRGRRWVEGRGTPERLPDGSTLWHGYIDDITERKRYEEAVVAAEASVRANAAKTEFLSRMSHELRTPLNAVLGFAQLLASDLRSPLDEGQRLRIGHIERAGQHLLAMIGDVLDLSRIEGGSLPLALQPVPVQRLIDESFALVSNTARGAGVRLLQGGSAAGAGLHLRADPMRMRQVMVNLLSNAIKYNRPGGQVTVDVKVRRPGQGAAEAPGRISLAVTDTGQGLTPLQQTHLFEPFNRLGAERGQVEGTGLGLAITLRLVELMSGAIVVHSEPGRGSTFLVELPLDDSMVSAEAPSGPDGAGPASLPGAADLVVLYAEDNELNVELVRQLLMLRAGCELRVARNGREAIDAALRAPPDLLLIDMHLGDMGGVQVLDALRSDPALRDVPRIALSADALPQSIEAARNAGFDEYLTKPVDIEELLRCLDRHRGRRRASWR